MTDLLNQFISPLDDPAEVADKFTSQVVLCVPIDGSSSYRVQVATGEWLISDTEQTKGDTVTYMNRGEPPKHYLALVGNEDSNPVVLTPQTASPKEAAEVLNVQPVATEPKLAATDIAAAFNTEAAPTPSWNVLEQQAAHTQTEEPKANTEAPPEEPKTEEEAPKPKAKRKRKTKKQKEAEAAAKTEEADSCPVNGFIPLTQKMVDELDVLLEGVEVDLTEELTPTSDRATLGTERIQIDIPAEAINRLSKVTIEFN